MFVPSSEEEPYVSQARWPSPLDSVRVFVEKIVRFLERTFPSSFWFGSGGLEPAAGIELSVRLASGVGLVFGV